MKMKEMRKTHWSEINLENSCPSFLLADRPYSVLMFLHALTTELEVSDPRGTFTWTTFAQYNVYQVGACDDCDLNVDLTIIFFLRCVY